jgi:putative hydrolase of the HAD superfamily
VGLELTGVLFDLDGTLADTAGAERDAWDAIADVIEHHVPSVDRHELYTRYTAVFEPHWTAFLAGEIDFGEYRRRRLGDAIAPWAQLDDTLFEAYRQEKRRGVERLQPFAAAVPTLRRARSLGLRVGLLTNGPSELQRHKLAVTGLAGELDSIAISEEIGAAKPDRRAFELAAALLDCELGTLAMVGDSPAYDIEGALAAGVAAAVLVAGGRPLAVPGARVVETLEDVADALGFGRTGRGS